MHHTLTPHSVRLRAAQDAQQEPRQTSSLESRPVPSRPRAHELRAGVAGGRGRAREGLTGFLVSVIRLKVYADRYLKQPGLRDNTLSSHRGLQKTLLSKLRKCFQIIVILQKIFMSIRSNKMLLCFCLYSSKVKWQLHTVHAAAASLAAPWPARPQRHRAGNLTMRLSNVSSPKYKETRRVLWRFSSGTTLRLYQLLHAVAFVP